MTATNLPGLIVEWLQRITVPPSASQPFPTPHFPPVVTPTSIGSSIIGVYNAVEPWVRYGFDVAAYAVGWIPYVGWLAPQVTIFYNFGERITRSITYNIAYWLDGNISFGQGLVNVGVDTINAFIYLANAQLGFWLPPLPPIPSLPPIFLPFAATEATTELTAAATLSATSTDAAKLNDLQSTVEGEVLGEQAADDDATLVATDEVTAKGEKASEVDAVKEPKVDAVKETKEPTEPKATTEVAARVEVRGAANENTAEPTKVSNSEKADPGADGQSRAAIVHLGGRRRHQARHQARYEGRHRQARRTRRARRARRTRRSSCQAVART